jgi:hypothetical protein
MKCTNANRGTFNHECNKPACWIGTHSDGHRQYFCNSCRHTGDEAQPVKSWEAFEPPYGEHLPLFPTFYSWPSNPLTEDRIERTVERLCDFADKVFLDGRANSEQYERWQIALNAWVREQYAAIA